MVKMKQRLINSQIMRGVMWTRSATALGRNGAARLDATELPGWMQHRGAMSITIGQQTPAQCGSLALHAEKIDLRPDICSPLA